MKKKLLLSLSAFFIIALASFSVAFAERYTECPVTLTASYGSDTTIEKFDIYNVENLYGEYKNRVYYDFKDTGYISLHLICYDAQGIPLVTLPFNEYDDYIDVPDTTAMVELVSAYGSGNSNTLFKCNYINAYSADGRVIGITELQVPVYKMVGWYPEVTVYADDNRSMKISPFQVEVYANVGWYTAEVSLFRTISSLYNVYKTAGDYQSIIDLVDEYLPLYENTSYAQSLYAIRTDAMDCWRNSSNSPFPSVEYSISENSIGTPEANITFTNVSYKTIVAFKAKFTCYNIFGNLEKTYYDSYFCDDTYVNPAETYTYTWTLYGADSVNRITNIRVTEVVFSDGTKWYR